ncbi:zinc-binding dehydrogenase [bacterium]|nr:zinc-binding dehydrogenase [bacterium]
MSKTQMKAIAVVKDAPLKLIEIDRPVPGQADVLIRVEAAGVNRPDLLQRSGLYPPPPGAPATLGLEVAGVVEAVGAQVTRWKAGDRVCALLGGGGYAEYATVHEGSVLPIPEPLDFVGAASLPETVFTVWNNVFHICKLKPGEAFLVHGGASGIGVAAIQMTAAWGARVYATAGTDEKCRTCEALGATRAVNYRTERFDEVLAAEGGVDVILDMVGAPYFEANVAILKDLGRLAYIAFLHGSRIEGDFMRLMLKRLTVTGSTLRIRSTDYKAMLAREIETHVWPMIREELVRPVIDSVFPLAEAEAAHARLTGGDHVGKIVLTPGA